MDDQIDSCLEPMKKLSMIKNNTVKKNKKGGTLFWGVDVDMGDFPDNHELIEHADRHGLIRKNEYHITVLFLGGSCNPEKEQKYLDIEGKKCEVVTSSYGKASNAIAIKVDSMVYIDEHGNKIPIPSDQEEHNCSHITVALDKNTKPKDSVKILNDINNIVELKSPVVLYGKVKRYR
jgi:hypothetical protein